MRARFSNVCQGAGVRTAPPQRPPLHPHSPSLHRTCPLPGLARAGATLQTCTATHQVRQRQRNPDGQAGAPCVLVSRDSHTHALRCQTPAAIGTPGSVGCRADVGYTQQVESPARQGRALASQRDGTWPLAGAHRSPEHLSRQRHRPRGCSRSGVTLRDV
ncbi:hypothetical protein TREES_T100015909 [Tupaia chinensis]|uniref:Uncharacterized protein n=1 Tax=Tupaia chinensis TaxID=246437 RepID=L9KWP4_TUPCH|nr:hypothetical protein TREES_T100015909 [Tupaia chinensis]